MSLHLTLIADRAALRDLSELRLHARFENRGKRPLAAIIDATPLSHGRYTVEIHDAAGRPADLHSFGRCGTMAPLMDHEIFLVGPGAAVDTPVGSPLEGRLAPGDYRVRVTYDAHQSTHGKDGWTPVVKDRLQHFWAGTLVSDWLPFTIDPTS